MLGANRLGPNRPRRQKSIGVAVRRPLVLELARPPGCEGAATSRAPRLGALFSSAVHAAQGKAWGTPGGGGRTRRRRRSTDNRRRR